MDALSPLRRLVARIHRRFTPPCLTEESERVWLDRRQREIEQRLELLRIEAEAIGRGRGERDARG